jgi:signal transduction histidine kinase
VGCNSRGASLASGGILGTTPVPFFAARDKEGSPAAHRPLRASANTNVSKHAYPEGKPGQVVVTLGRADAETVRLSVRDEGAGLPVEFDVERSGGLGLRILRALLTQTSAKLSIHRHQPGSEFVIEFPMQART